MYEFINCRVRKAKCKKRMSKIPSILNGKYRIRNESEKGIDIFFCIINQI